jgi:hypothetical protein
MTRQAKQRTRPAGDTVLREVLVIGSGKLDAGGKVWAVQSRSSGGQWHRVTLRLDGRLTCTCPGATFGKQCWHRRAVQDRLACHAEWEAVLQLRAASEGVAQRSADEEWVR